LRKVVYFGLKQAFNTELNTLLSGRDLSQQQPPPPPPPEIKKSNRLIAVAIVMLLIGVGIGAVVGWSIGQSQSHAVQSEYTWVKVFGDSQAYAKLGGYEYTFLYKSHYYYDPEKPIEIREAGRSSTQAIPATAGKTYDVLGSIQVVVSEVHDDYVILLVKPL
jgi:hypothetical protein